jgi:thioredoxin reductase (NADPH)
MQHRVNSRENIELKYNSEVKEVLGENVVEGLKIINNKKRYWLRN